MPQIPLRVADWGLGFSKFRVPHPCRVRTATSQTIGRHHKPMEDDLPMDLLEKTGIAFAADKSGNGLHQSLSELMGCTELSSTNLRMPCRARDVD